MLHIYFSDNSFFSFNTIETTKSISITDLWNNWWEQGKSHGMLILKENTNYVDIVVCLALERMLDIVQVQLDNEVIEVEKGEIVQVISSNHQ